MNVMTKAHKMVKEAIAAQVANGVERTHTYSQMLSIALKIAHKEFKAMQFENIKTTTVNTHQLVEGDRISYYGCIFELYEMKNWGLRADNCPTLQGDCITFKTKLIHHPDFTKKEGDDPFYAFPVSWAKDYHVQGNKLATWAKIVK